MIRERSRTVERTKTKNKAKIEKPTDIYSVQTAMSALQERNYRADRSK